MLYVCFLSPYTLVKNRIFCLYPIIITHIQGFTFPNSRKSSYNIWLWANISLQLGVESQAFSHLSWMPPSLDSDRDRELLRLTVVCVCPACCVPLFQVSSVGTGPPWSRRWRRRESSLWATPSTSTGRAWRASWRTRWLSASPPRSWLPGTSWLAPTTTSATDRKSTRLNSSHL